MISDCLKRVICGSRKPSGSKAIPRSRYSSLVDRVILLTAWPLTVLVHSPLLLLTIPAPL